MRKKGLPRFPMGFLLSITPLFFGFTFSNNHPQPQSCSIEPSGLNQPLESLFEKLTKIEDQFATSKNCFENERLNFGVLVYNPNFKIYRSTGLGKKGLEFLREHLEKNELEFPKKIIYVNHYGENQGNLFKNLYLKLAGKFYSSDFSAQQRAAAEESEKPESRLPHFTYISEKSGNGVYIEGKARGKNKESGTIFWAGKSGAPALYQTLREVLISEGAVDFHCKGGLHRTGMIALMIRYLQGGNWTLESPQYSGLTKRHGQSPRLTQFKNKAQYEYFQHNPKNFRQENLNSIEALSNQPLFLCLKEKFGPYLNASSVAPRAGQKTIACLQDASTSWENLSNQAVQPLSVEDKQNLWKQCEAQYPQEDPPHSE